MIEEILPTIEIKLDRNFCLYDFLTRIIGRGPYKNEKKLYFKKIKNIKNFSDFYSKYWNRKIDYRFFMKHIKRFDNDPFKKLWNEFYPILQKQHTQIKEIVKKEGKIYLKKILIATKNKGYLYNKIIVFLSFPGVYKTKPIKYQCTGSSQEILNQEYKKNICVVYIGLKPDIKLNDSKDLFVLWHEIIHTFDLPSYVWRDIDEAITELYEDVVIEAQKKKIEERLIGFFETSKKYPEKLTDELVKTCLNWDWKKRGALQLKFELANKYNKNIKLK